MLETTEILILKKIHYNFIFLIGKFFLKYSAIRLDIFDNEII